MDAAASRPFGTRQIEAAGVVALAGVAGTLLFSIAVAQILLTLALVCWLVLVITDGERFEAPRFFLPLLA